VAKRNFPIFLRLLSVFSAKQASNVRPKVLKLGVIGIFAILCSFAGSVSAAEQGPIIFQPAALEYTGTYELRQMDPNLTGLDVTIAAVCRSLTYANGRPQNDYRPKIEHKCLKGREIAFHDSRQSPAGFSPHSTAIGSILVGRDPNGYQPLLGNFYYQGAAPQADLDVYEFRTFVVDNVFTRIDPEAEIITMSVGSQFEEWWTRGIDSMAEHRSIIIVAGIGNGSNVYDPVLYPAAGSNVLGVGVIGSANDGDLPTTLANFGLPGPEFSSCGPTQDRRCKPDIVAPGNCLVADVNNTQAYQATGSWSSFASPVTAGTIALLVQKAKQEPNISSGIFAKAGNCVVKAILMNSAEKLPFWHKGKLSRADDHNVPLDYSQGAGLLDAVAAYEHLTVGPMGPGKVSIRGWDNNVLGQSQKTQNVYKIRLDEPVGQFITATLVWNRHYEDKYPFASIPEKNKNLRLELWTIDANTAERDYLLDYSDSIADNVEHIYCPADGNCSQYEMVVSFSDSNESADANDTERYGLAWNAAGDGPDRESILWYDLNLDGTVDDTDFRVLLDNFASSANGSENYVLGDINSDGVIDFDDLELLENEKGRKAYWLNP